MRASDVPVETLASIRASLQRELLRSLFLEGKGGSSDSYRRAVMDSIAIFRDSYTIEFGGKGLDGYQIPWVTIDGHRIHGEELKWERRSFEVLYALMKKIDDARDAKAIERRLNMIRFSDLYKPGDETE